MFKLNRKKIKPSLTPLLNSSTPPKTASPLQTVVPSSSNISESVKIAYRAARIYGLLPYTINYNSNGEIDSCSVRAFDILWFIISVTTSVTFSVFGFFALTPTADIRTTVLLLGGRIILIGSVLLTAISIVLDELNRHRIVDMLKTITFFDKEITAFQVYVDHESELKFVRIFYRYTLMATIIISIFAYYINTWLFQNETGFNIFVYNILNVISYGQSGSVFKQYLVLLMGLRSRFKLLNLLMRKQFLSINNAVQTITTIQKIKKSIHFDVLLAVARLHNKLCGTMDTINICYSFQIMMNLGICLSELVLALYTFYRNISIRNDLTQQLTYINFMATSFYTMYSVSVINCANTLMNEGRESSKIIHKIINRLDNEKLNERLLQFSQQLQHQYPVVTCGLFTIDWTIFYSIIGTAATYLTIIVQFDTPIKTKTITTNTTMS